MTSESDQLKDAKHAAVGLKPEELQNLIAFLNFRLRGKAAATGTVLANNLPDQILNLICDVARHEGIERAIPATLRKHAAYTSFVRKVDENVAPFLEYVRGHNKVRKEAFLRVAIGLLFDNLQDMQVPRSTLMAMNHIHRLQSVVDNSFPGYAKNGLLHMVVRMENQSSPARGGKVQR